MNDERPIEKLLRRQAKERRAQAGAPVEMHPATRRLLQGEVTRQLRAGQPRPAGAGHVLEARPFWGGWLPRFAGAVTVLVLVAIGAWWWLTPQAKHQLALVSTVAPESMAPAGSDGVRPEPKAGIASRTEARSLQTARAEPTPASIPVSAQNQPGAASGLADRYVSSKSQDANAALSFAATPTSAAEQKREAARGRDEGLVWADKSATLTAAAPVAARSQPERQAASAEALLSPRAAAVVRERQPATALTNTAGPAAISPPNKVSESESAQAYAYSQAFSRQAAPIKEKVAKLDSAGFVSPVLANFRVEQSGRQLRVVDSDGSTYTGEAEPVLATGASGGGGKPEPIGQLFKSGGKLNQLPAGPAATAQPQTQSHRYRVVGTNRTLNQNVVFSWNFVELTNMPVLAKSGRPNDAVTKDVKKLPNQFPSALQNSFISGRAQFGSGKEIEINAVPVSP